MNVRPGTMGLSKKHPNCHCESPKGMKQSPNLLQRQRSEIATLLSVARDNTFLTSLFLKLPLLTAIFLIAVSGSTSFAGQVSTNEQFVMDAVYQITSNLLDSLDHDTGHFTIGKVDGIDELAVNGMRLALLNHGWINSNGENNSGDNPYIVNITFSALNFGYKKGESLGFLKKSYIRRNIDGQVLVKIVGPEYSYVGFRDISDSDEFAPDQANYVASLRYNQLSPSLPGAGLKRILEPVTVTAAAGALIYLFFANR